MRHPLYHVMKIGSILPQNTDNWEM